MKKLSIGLAVLLAGLSANSFAALPSGASKFCVNVPCFNGGFTFGLAGLYLRPSTSHLDYAVTFPTSTPAATALLGGDFHSVDPDYDWGWRVNVGYIFPCTGNDVVLTYTDWDDSESDNTVRAPGGQLFGTIALFAAPAASASAAAGARARFEYQAVDLDFGQHINIDCGLRMRWFAGLRWADLEHKFNVDYIATATGVTGDDIFASASQKSEFDGIGPRFGVDASYHIGSGFGVVGHTAVALLVGDQDTSYNSTLIENVTGTTVRSFKYNDDTRVVPNLDARLGVDYSYQFCNCERTKLTVEVGYMVDHYFNSIDRVGDVTIIEPDDLVRHTIDTSFDGPYISVQVNV